MLKDIGTTQVAESKGKNCDKEDPPTESEDQIQSHLRILKGHEPMGSYEINQLVDEVAKPQAAGAAWVVRVLHAEMAVGRDTWVG